MWNMNSGGNGRLSWLVSSNLSSNGDGGDAYLTPPNDTHGKSWYEPGYSRRGDFRVPLDGATTYPDNVNWNGDKCGTVNNEKYVLSLTIQHRSPCVNESVPVVYFAIGLCMCLSPAISVSVPSLPSRSCVGYHILLLK